MYNLIAMTDVRIRDEQGNKVDYKKGAKVSLVTKERADFYARNGWKLLEDKDVANVASAKLAKEEAVAKEVKKVAVKKTAKKK